MVRAARSAMERDRFTVVLANKDASAGLPAAKTVALSQLEVCHDGLRLWNLTGSDVLNHCSFEEVEGWWCEDDVVVVVVRKPKGVEELVLKTKDPSAVANALSRMVDAMLDSRQVALAARDPPPSEVQQRLGAPPILEHVHEGWLKKRRNKFPYTLQDRYFVCQKEGEAGLEEYVLKYYLTRPRPPPSHERDGPLGAIKLTEVELLSTRSKGGDDLKIVFRAWQINKMRERRWVLLCPNKDEKERWGNALRQCMQTHEAKAADADASDVSSMPSTPATTASSLDTDLSDALDGDNDD